MIEIQRAETENVYDVYSLSIDGHLILSKYYGDLDWILIMENAIKNLFPHLINLSASKIKSHRDCLVLKTFVKHQEDHFKRYILGAMGVNSFFDYDYSPSHYFNYSVPSEAQSA
jgi:hypothetical protein